MEFFFSSFFLGGGVRKHASSQCIIILNTYTEQHSYLDQITLSLKVQYIHFIATSLIHLSERKHIHGVEQQNITYLASWRLQYTGNRTLGACTMYLEHDADLAKNLCGSEEETE